MHRTRVHAKAFLHRIRTEALLDSDADAERAVRAVAATMWNHMTEGVLEHAFNELPSGVRPLFVWKMPRAERRGIVDLQS